MIIPFPSVLRPISTGLSRTDPAQVNRSSWTGRSKVLILPTAEVWAARPVFRPLYRERDIRQARAFFSALRGPGNAFDLPVLPTPQSKPPMLTGTWTNIANMTTITALGSGWFQLGSSGGDGTAYGPELLARDFVLTLRAFAGDIYLGVTADAVPVAGSVNKNRVYNSGVFISVDDSSITDRQVYSPGFLYAFLRRTGSTVETLAGNSPDVTKARLVHVFPYENASDVKAFILITNGGNAQVLTSYYPNDPLTTGALAAGALVMNMAPANYDYQSGVFGSLAMPSGHKRLFVTKRVLGGGFVEFEPSLQEAVASGAKVNMRRPVLRCRLAGPEQAFPDGEGGVQFSCDVVEAV